MSTTKRVGENAESKPLNLRLPHAVGDQLDALAASLPIVSRHRLAVEALRLGIAALMADPSILLRGAATPSTSAPATPGAPAPVRPVASPVVPVEASPATPGVEALAAEVARARALPAMLAAEDRAAPPVDPREEIRRIAPVLKGLAGRVRYLSVDTRHAQTMRLALDLGANFINDISALSFDPQALDVAASAQGPVCLMHMRGTPETMSQYTIYNNIIEDVLEYFVERIAVCERAGIERRRLVLDPGLGFAKTTAQNLTLIREIGRVCALGFPVLMGASRKRFISEADRDCAPDQRLGGSLASALYAAAQGVKILRVHDVAATRQALAVQQALQLNSPPTRR